MNSQKTLDALKKEYKYVKPTTKLSHSDPVELMMATILSAQCTDDRVNKVTPPLFRKYPTLKAFANADVEDLKKMVRSTGYFNQKARRLKESAQYVITNFDGKMPDNIDELVQIPGVGRKTANIILTYGFGKTQGIAVDTHVGRVTYRLGLTDSLSPEKAEKDLMKAFKKTDWESVNDLFIDHGRRICKSQKPQCSKCILAKLCPRNGVVKSA